MNHLYKSFDLVCEFINSSDFKSDSVYCEILSKLNDYLSDFKNKSCAIFFIEDSSLVLKCGIRNGKTITKYLPDNKIIDSCEDSIILNTKPDGLFFENTVLIKLAVRSSVFGFMAFSFSDTIDNSLVKILTCLSSVIAYKIKDYELNEVFKIQLKAMQDAVIEKENAYEIINKQHKKLQELDKTKSLFLANISHELRTPLNAIIGFSQALDSQIFGTLNDKQSEYIKDIQISSLHLLGMINEILDLSKLEANAMKFNPSDINANQTIQEVINILEPLYKNKNIGVDYISKFDGKIFADYQKFQQILYNLLSNAIKFTPEEGKIRVISYSKNQDYFLEISDTGIGIDKKYHNKIFKKFVHLNNVYIKNQSSTGLGLTITKELVKLHKGKITLESELNKGTTFKMVFKNIIV